VADYFNISHTVWWKLCDDLEKFCDDLEKCTACVFAVVLYVTHWCESWSVSRMGVV